MADAKGSSKAKPTNLVKLVTSSEEDNTTVIGVLKDGLRHAKAFEVTEVHVLMRDSQGEVYTAQHCMDEDRMVGLLEGAKFEILASRFLDVDVDMDIDDD